MTKVTVEFQNKGITIFLSSVQKDNQKERKTQEKGRLTPCSPCLWHRHPLPWLHSKAAPDPKTTQHMNSVPHWHAGNHRILHALLVSVSRFIRYLMPPHFRMVTLLAGILANSPRAPTTLTSTSSGCSDRRPTRVLKVSYS